MYSLTIPLIYLFWIIGYVLISPVISGLMIVFVLNKEFKNEEYLWKVCVSTIFAFCGIVFLAVYIPMFLIWLGMYYIIKTPYQISLSEGLTSKFNK